MINKTEDIPKWASDTIADLCSRDTHRVWHASCDVIQAGQYKERIMPFVGHLAQIKKCVLGLQMGGLFAPNQRFVDFAIRTIEFHQAATRCPCCLYLEHGVDPKKEEKRKLIQIREIVELEGGWIDYYIATCTRCSATFRVIEREAHFTWWEWKRI